MIQTKQVTILNGKAGMPIIYQRFSLVDLSHIKKLNKKNYFKKWIFLLNELMMNHVFTWQSFQQKKLVDQFYLLVDLKNCRFHKTLKLVRSN